MFDFSPGERNVSKGAARLKARKARRCTRRGRQTGGGLLSAWTGLRTNDDASIDLGRLGSSLLASGTIGRWTMLDSALWILEDGHVELFMNRKCIYTELRT